MIRNHQQKLDKWNDSDTNTSNQSAIRINKYGYYGCCIIKRTSLRMKIILGSPFGGVCGGGGGGRTGSGSGRGGGGGGGATWLRAGACPAPSPAHSTGQTVKTFSLLLRFLLQRSFRSFSATQAQSLSSPFLRMKRRLRLTCWSGPALVVSAAIDACTSKESPKATSIRFIVDIAIVKDYNSSEGVLLKE